MPEAHTSKVVRDSEAVVQKVLLVRLIWAQHEWAHVEALERKLYESVDFLAAAEPVLAALSLEALETDDKDAGHAVNL
jgi:protein-disulfide isomerase-like protein with CxxC motif